MRSPPTPRVSSAETDLAQAAPIGTNVQQNEDLRTADDSVNLLDVLINDVLESEVAP